MRLLKANEATATKRRVYFDLRDNLTGLAPALLEAAGQPQISTNGAPWTATGIGVLTHIGQGRYYATLTQTAVATAGDVIETRYKSVNTVESPGDSVQVVAFDPDDAAGLGLSRVDAAVTSRAAAADYTSGRAAKLDDIVNAAGILTQVNSGLVAARLDELLAADSDLDGAQPPTVGSVFHELLTKSTAGFTYDQTTDSLEAVRDSQAFVTAAAVADAVWDEARADHVAAGTFGQGAASVQGNVTGSVASVTGAVGSVAAGGITAASLAADAITAAKIADGAIDAATFAAGAINAAAIADGAIDAATFAAGAIDAAAIAADAIGSSELAASAVTEIQAGLATAAALATIDDFLDTEVAAILADTNELQTDWANGGRLDLILDARASQASVDALPTAAETATEVNTVLTASHGAGAWTDSGGAGSGAHTVTITLEDDQLVPEAVVGAMVTIKNAAETTVIAGPIPSDTAGQVVFNLNTATYRVLILSSSAYVPLPAQTLVVGGTTSVTYEIERQGQQTPSDASLCLVYGTLVKPNGLRAANEAVIFKLENTKGVETDGGLLVAVKSTITVLTSSLGYFEVELIRSSELEPHDEDETAQYRVIAPGAALDTLITVPDAANVDLVTLVPIPD